MSYFQFEKKFDKTEGLLAKKTKSAIAQNYVSNICFFVFVKRLVKQVFFSLEKIIYKRKIIF